ncbi:MAG: class I SAM-dependent DNA methyltransferase [Eubacteriales bacterium]|nr:class I SAM-dependent DNA methyltransferase [Eubacteriales bacterium]
MPNDKFSIVGTNIAEKATMIWNVADMLRGPFKPHEYGLVILPMTVVKRFHDCLLPTHDAVLAEYEKVKHFAVKDGFLTKASGYQFYNISKFTFDSLLTDPENIEANFRDYLAGFSANVQDVLAKFDFDTVIRRMVESNTLYLVIREFNSPKGYLGPDRITAVDCGYIFEDLVRRFSESFGEEAGAHFTSRDVVYLMTDLLLSDADLSRGGNVTVYDMAMGTSQMLSCMEERIHELNAEIGVTCFGQEFNPSTFAIAKADMMIRGGDPNNMRFGDTLSEDQFSGYTFQYIISNPPFGIDWKREQKAVEAENAKGELGRFAPGLPKISDGQQLFVLNGLAKLAHGGKMAIIQNGSPLFSGDAGSGPSEIRRYILENDWLDAIVQMSTDMFMNTGISTYIWVLNKDKPAHRMGKVQLIDASHCCEARRKSIGTKRNDVTDFCRELIVRAYGEFKDDAIYGDKAGVYCQSKIFDNETFGYRKITVERPLRQAAFINDETLDLTKSFLRQHQVDVDSNIIDLGGQITEREVTMPRTTGEIGAELNLRRYYQILLSLKREEPYTSISEVEKLFNARPLNPGTKLMRFSSFNSISLPELLLKTDPRGEIVAKRGKPVADADLRDTENVPLTEDVESYFKREVLPYAPDAWIDEKKTKVGYEIPMTRYFYEYQAPEKTEDIMARITALEQEISASLQALFHKEG